jgi:hypothetical protein
MNQGPRRISLMKKNGGQKSRDTIPLKKRRQYLLARAIEKFLHDLSESRTLKYV